MLILTRVSVGRGREDPVYPLSPVCVVFERLCLVRRPFRRPLSFFV